MARSFATGSAKEASLLSPWDGSAVSPTNGGYACPAAAQLPRDFATNSYYTDSRHSIVDPELKKKYEESVAPIESFSRSVVKAADTYRTTGNRAAAECAAELLDDAAKQQALGGRMEGHQAFYVQGWQLGSWAVAYLKIRNSGVVSIEQQREITTWLKRLAQDNEVYYEAKRRQRGPNDANNNHLYWAGFAICAAGVASNDRKLFDWGIEAYKEGARDIRPDGTLPMEMARGQRALHYHLYALAPLVMLAEFGEANGIDLYAERDYAIKRLADRCISGLGDPGFFQQKTGAPQEGTSRLEAWEIGWGQPYTRRFPNSKISALMTEAPTLSYTTWGGLPPP